MNERSRKDEFWQGVELNRRLPHFGNQQQRMQKRADGIRRDTRLVVLLHRELERKDASILYKDIEALQPLS